MVGRGKKDAHQLPGASGCHSSSQIICQTQNQNFNSAEDRQHHGNGIHKSSGGTISHDLVKWTKNLWM